MKVVILAGGLGTRMREETGTIPKPMVEIGGRPVIWHIMRNLSRAGYNDFVIATGYKGHVISDFFANLRSRVCNLEIDYGSSSIEYSGGFDEERWKVTIVDTGEMTPTAGRLKRASEYLGDTKFGVLYGDGLADVDFSGVESCHDEAGKVGTVTVCYSSGRFGSIERDDKTGLVTSFREKPRQLVSIGFFVFETEFLKSLDEDMALEEEPLRTLASNGELNSFVHNGFWQPMDTLSEYQKLRDLWDTGKRPWLLA